MSETIVLSNVDEDAKKNGIEQDGGDGNGRTPSPAP